MACKTTGQSGSKLFRMFLCNYAMFCGFKSAKVAAPPQTPLAGVGASRHAITFAPHLNPGSTPDLAKRKGTLLVSMYPLSNTRGSSRIWPNSRGTSPPPPPPPPLPGIRIWPNARGEWSWAWGGGAPNTFATPLNTTKMKLVLF